MDQQLQYYIQSSLFTPTMQSNIEKILSEKWMEWENQSIDTELVEYIIVRYL